MGVQWVQGEAGLQGGAGLQWVQGQGEAAVNMVALQWFRIGKELHLIHG